MVRFPCSREGREGGSRLRAEVERVLGAGMGNGEWGMGGGQGRRKGGGREGDRMEEEGGRREWRREEEGRRKGNSTPELTTLAIDSVCCLPSLVPR